MGRPRAGQGVGDDHPADDGAAFSRSSAGGDSTAVRGHAQTSGGPRSTSRSAPAQMVPAVSIMSSMSTQQPALDLAHHLQRLHLVGGAPGSPLVDDGEVGLELLAVPLGDLHPTGVGGDDDHVLRPVALELVHEHRQRRQVVDGNVEEPLDLPGVEVDRHRTVGAGDLQHVGHELGGDRLAPGRLRSCRE